MIKRIQDYTHYTLDELGTIKNSKGRQLKPWIAKSGYYTVELCKHGKLKSFLVHRLIAIHFIDNPLNYPCVNHLDGDKLNNDISNLEWCTHSQNQYHAYKNGLNCKKGESGANKITERQARNIKYGDWGKLSYAKIGKRYGISATQVMRIKKGISWSHI